MGFIPAAENKTDLDYRYTVKAEMEWAVRLQRDLHKLIPSTATEKDPTTTLEEWLGGLKAFKKSAQYWLSCRVNNDVAKQYEDETELSWPQQPVNFRMIRRRHGTEYM